MSQVTQHLYRDDEGLYYFGTPDGVIVLAPSALDLLTGIKETLTHLDAVDPERAWVQAAQGFIELIPLDQAPGNLVDMCHPDELEP